MRLLKKLCLLFISACKSWFYASYAVPDIPYKTIRVNESLPNRLEKNVLYIVIEDDYSEQAAMICPCGCDSILHMNLLLDERPCWRVIMHEDKTASLHPSVWRKTGCKSHFWFKRGKIEWC